MSEEPSEPKKEEPSEDVAKLYFHARGPGTQYLGYSASRKQVQERFRDRIARAHAERAGHADFGPSAAAAPPTPDQAPTSQDPSPLTETEASARPAPQAEPPSYMPELSEFASILFAASTLPGLEPPPPPSPPRRHRVPPVTEERVAEGEIPLPPLTLPPGFAQRPPALVVFSLVNGVGKTCLVATLGRALSALGEPVLLADTAAGGALPAYFGAREGRSGLVRTFSPFPFSGTTLELEGERIPIKLLHLEAERFPRFASGQDLLLGSLVQEGRGHHRLLIDVATAGREFSRLLPLQPTILLPIEANAEAMTNVDALESLLATPRSDHSEPEAFFLLNRFDIASAQQREVRETLQLRLGERLLPFALRTSEAVEKAHTEGMTVVDYAAKSALAEDYRHLAAWLRTIAAPQPEGGPLKRSLSGGHLQGGTVAHSSFA